MARWYTSDHHFGHRNIIGYCDRPFSDVDEINDAMVERWNDLVAEGDEVWVIGNIALGDLRSSLIEHVARLRGRKILVPGNHNRCWTGRNKHETSRSDYLQLGGFERIVDAPKPLRIGRKKVRVSHLRYLLDDVYDLNSLDHRPRDDGRWLLHGHIHRNGASEAARSTSAWTHGTSLLCLRTSSPSRSPADRDTLPPRAPFRLRRH